MILHLRRFVPVSQMLLGPNSHILPHMLHVFPAKTRTKVQNTHLAVNTKLRIGNQPHYPQEG